jgi:hypothetical protein
VWVGVWWGGWVWWVWWVWWVGLGGEGAGGWQAGAAQAALAAAGGRRAAGGPPGQRPRPRGRHHTASGRPPPQPPPPRDHRRQLAQQNLNRQEAIAEANNQLAIVKSADYVSTKQHFDKLMVRQQEVLENLGSEPLRRALAKALEDAEKGSESFVTNFGKKQVRRWVGVLAGVAAGAGLAGELVLG